MLPQQLTPRGDWRVTAEARAPDREEQTDHYQEQQRLPETQDNWRETERTQRLHKYTQNTSYTTVTSTYYVPSLGKVRAVNFN